MAHGRIHPPWRRVACVGGALAALLTGPATLAAQAQCDAGADTSAAALAARYAPVLRFAPSERYFPTLPFFTAFDGQDNNGNHLVDFEDPDEIAPVSRNDTLHASWVLLDSLYLEAEAAASPALPDGPPVAPLPAVFYNVRSLDGSQRAAMRRLLKKDLLGWDRAENAIPDLEGFLAKPFKVVEYYFYYVRDKGLVGHPQDIEFAYVFVPADPALACEFRIIVGTGHTQWVPNNVLILTNELVLGLKGLARTDTLTGLLPELGGHSNAPDVPPLGQFRLGIDVNWETTKAWGTRDVQALAQMGYGGAYRPDMTLPRDTVYHPVYLWPRGASFNYGQRYSLLPASLFARLFDEVNPDPVDESPPRLGPTAVRLIRAQLDSVAALLGRPEFSGVDSLSVASLRRMAAWDRPLLAPGVPHGGIIAPERGLVWQHWTYASPPQVVFKSYLFPPSTKSVEGPLDVLRLISWGVTEWPGNSHQLQVGIVIPWFYLPFESRGFMNLEAGIIANENWSGRDLALDLSYYSSYFQRVSWYSTLAWIPDDAVTGSHFTVSLGPSLLLWMRTDKSLLGPVNVVRFSTGPRFRLSGPSSTAGVDWEFKFTLRQ